MDDLYTIEDLRYSYTDTEVLHGLNLSFTPGKFYGILGPNACGKSTLLDLLAGYKKPTSGSILLQNREVSGYPKKLLATKVALVPQEFEINLGFSIRDIVMMGRHPHIPRFSAPNSVDHDAVSWALEATQLSALQNRSATALSGGQKQRTVVARALAQKTEIILFDEATSSLDIEYSLQIFRLAKRLVQSGKTVIAVLHNLNLAAAYCDDILFMKDGNIHCFGPTPKVMTGGVIQDVFGVKAQVGTDLYGQEFQVSLQYQ